MGYDVMKIREDFPILKRTVHDKPLVYFDNSATTQKPQCVIDAITECYTSYNSNIHRGIHHLSQLTTNAHEEARKTAQEFLNAKHSHEIVFTRGATEAINLVAHSFAKTFLKEGDEIIISAMEHHSNLVPWQMLRETIGITLKIIPFTDNGELELADFENYFNQKTKLVSVVHVSNSLGTVNPIENIIEIAHKHNVPVLIDAAQSVQHKKIDVQKLDCDFLAFSGHKIYGPTGIGALYGKEEWLDKLYPYEGGGDMIETVSLEKTIFNALPFKFEAGTANFVGAIALAEALKYVSALGLEAIEAHEHALLEYATEQLESFENLTIYGNAGSKSGAISFLFKGVHPADVGMILDKQGIAVRTGTHCTEPVMQKYGIQGTVRASFGLYNTKEEIDAFIVALKRTQMMFM